MQSSKLKTKDIITVVLLALVNTIIFGLGTFFYLAPVLILMMPVFYSLFQGIVFFMLGLKVQKKGAILLYSIIMGVIGFNPVYILMHVIAGIIAEIIMSKIGYGNLKGLTISYIILQMLACIGSTIYPYAIVLNSTLNGIEGNGNLGVNIEAAGNMLRSWFMIVFIIIVFASAWIGAFLGKKIVKKHLKKTA